jgi:hypothetical protein
MTVFIRLIEGVTAGIIGFIKVADKPTFSTSF